MELLQMPIDNFQLWSDAGLMMNLTNNHQNQTARLLRISSRAWREFQAARKAYGPIDPRTVLAFKNFQTFRRMLDAK